MSEGFRLFTYATPDYREICEPVFVPSWYKLSGAKAIDIVPVEGPTPTAVHLQKPVVIGKYLQEHYGERCLYMDIDAFTVRAVGGGFTDRPIGVARWPNINAGVLFFNTALCGRNYWTTFCDRWAKMTASMHKDGTAPHNDQDALRVLLSQQEYINDCKYMDYEIWNYCPDCKHFLNMFPGVKDRVRIVHLKVCRDIASGRGPDPDHVKAVKEAFKL